MNSRVLWGIVFLVIIIFICLMPMLSSHQAGVKTPLLPVGDSVRLFAINVGKADSLILQAEGKNYLIDTGSVQSYGALRSALNALQITQLDGVFLTHTHKDHAGGIQQLANSDLPINAWYAPKYSVIDKEKKHPAYTAASTRKMNGQWLSAGDEIAISDDVILTVLGPRSLDKDEENNNSLVMVLTSPHGNMLLAGDMEHKEEQSLLAAGVIPPCEVLKVAHHGEDDSTSPAFAIAVSPQAHIISTNSIEEPDTPEGTVLTALQNAGAAISVTQNAKGGISCTLTNGQAATALVSFDTIPQLTSSLSFIHFDTEHEILTIQNSSSTTIPLADWYVFSAKGDEVFVFPQDAVIGPGASITLGTLNTTTACTFTWQDKNVWHNKKLDTVLLYDPWGRVVAQTTNGLTTP